MPDQNQSDPNQTNPVIADPQTVSSPPVQQDPSVVPPIFSPQADLPPLPPDFQNVPSQTPIEPMGLPTETPAEVGSAAPIDLPPMTSGPKKKFGGGKIVATILGLFLLVGGVGAGIILTQQQQLFQQKATAPTCGSTGASCGGKEDLACCSGFECGKEGSCIALSKDSCTTGQTRACGSCGTQTCAGGTYGTCQNQGVCSPGASRACGNFGTQSCNSQCAWGTCTGEQAPQCLASGASCGKETAACCTGLTCGSSGKCAAPAPQCLASGASCGKETAACCTSLVCGSNGKCSAAPDDNGDKEALCPQISIGTTSISVGSLYSTSCYVNRYWCPTGITGTQSCGTSNGQLVDNAVQTSSFSKSCGVEQIDLYCPSCGYGGTIADGGEFIHNLNSGAICGSDLPSAPSCIAVKAYDATWNLLSNAQLSALKKDNVVNFCVAGSAPSGTFDKAQFKINTTLAAETTTKRPSSSDFCQSYTILSTDTTVSVKAKVHHTTSGWIGESI